MMLRGFLFWALPYAVGASISRQNKEETKPLVNADANAFLAPRPSRVGSKKKLTALAVGAATLAAGATGYAAGNSKFLHRPTMGRNFRGSLQDKMLIEPGSSSFNGTWWNIGEGSHMVHGVNFGNLFVLEKWMNGAEAYWEGSRSESMGSVPADQIVDKYKAHLELHFADMERVFQQLQEAGINFIRVPVGFFNFIYYHAETTDEQQGVANALAMLGQDTSISTRYLNQVFEYGKQYGIQVSLEMHSVPGGNGDHNSGFIDGVAWGDPNHKGFFDYNNCGNNQHAGLKSIAMMCDLCAQHENCGGCGLSNEPHPPDVGDCIRNYWTESIHYLRGNGMSTETCTDEVDAYLQSDNSGLPSCKADFGFSSRAILPQEKGIFINADLEPSFLEYAKSMEMDEANGNLVWEAHVYPWDASAENPMSPPESSVQDVKDHMGESEGKLAQWKAELQGATGKEPHMFVGEFDAANVQGWSPEEKAKTMASIYELMGKDTKGWSSWSWGFGLENAGSLADWSLKHNLETDNLPIRAIMDGLDKKGQSGGDPIDQAIQDGISEMDF